MAKLAGDAYLVGDISLFLLGGGLGGRWNDLIAGGGSIVAAVMLSKAGDRPFWFVLSSALGVPLVVLASLDGLLAGSYAAWCGAVIFCAGQMIGVFNQPLSARFERSPSLVWHRLLGRSRRTMGVLVIVGKLPIIANALSCRDWVTGWALTAWIMGDICLGLSSVSDREFT